MELRTHEEDGVVVVDVDGEIDLRTALPLVDALVAVLAAHRKIVLDMHGVSYMSSSGLRAMLSIHRMVIEKGARLIMVGLSDEVRDIMSMTGFLPFFSVQPSLTEAHASLQA